MQLSKIIIFSSVADDDCLLYKVNMKHSLASWFPFYIDTLLEYTR